MITGMKKGRTKTVLLSKNFLSMPEIRGILDYARSRQWILRVPRMLNLAEEARNWQGDGVISDNECAMKELKARGIAMVGLTDLPPELLRNADILLASDDNRIGTMAADYFLHRGYRNFVCAAVNLRRTAFLRRIGESGFRSETIDFALDSCPGQYGKELESVLRKTPRPFCVFCDNDFDAAVVADAAGSVGLRIPEDIAILGVGNESFFSNPSALALSSVDSRLYERAFCAAKCMEQLLDGELPRREANGGEPTIFRFAPSGIVERESTDFYAVETPRLRKMVHFLQENAPSQFFRVSELAGKFLLTESSVYRAFRARFGISPKQFLLEERLRMAQRRLADTDDTLSAVADSCGFPGPGALHYAFRRKFGCSPNEWRQADPVGRNRYGHLYGDGFTRCRVCAARRQAAGASPPDRIR